MSVSPGHALFKRMASETKAARANALRYLYQHAVEGRRATTALVHLRARAARLAVAQDYATETSRGSPAETL